MQNTLAKLIALTAVFFLARAQEDLNGGIFERDSVFMQGFEKGYLLLKRGQAVEDFGCYMPENLKANDRAAHAYETVKKGFESVKSALELDPVIDEAINMVLIKLDSMYQFIAVLSPQNRADEYCTGMIFGMKGSDAMLRIANRMINPKVLY